MDQKITPIAARRRRRLLLLGLIVVVLVVLLGGLYFFRQIRKAQRASKLFTQGMEAFQKDDYAQAIEHLDKYMHNTGQPDTQAMYSLAVADQEVKDPQKRNLFQALQMYRRIYEQTPDYRDAAKRLMEIYLQTSRDTDTLDIANRLLQKNPKDAEALRSKTVVLTRLKRNRQALDYANQTLAVNPKDLQIQVIRFRLLFDQGTPAAKLIDQAQALAQKYPDDPRFTLLRAYGHVLNKDSKQTRRWLLAAAKADPPSETYTQVLVRSLDNAGMFERALEVLQQRVAANPQSLWMDDLVRRLFERGRYENLIQQVHFDKDNPPADRPDRASLLAISLYELHKTDRAQEVVRGMEANHDKVYATTLADLIQTIYQGSSQPKAIIAAAKDVLKVNANQPYARYMLGQAQLRLGEREAAAENWDKVIAQRPGWISPRIQKARLLLNSGAPKKALNVARDALVLQPNNVNAALVLAKALAAANDMTQPDQAKTAMTMVDRILAVVEDQPQALLLKTRIATAGGDRATAVRTANRLMDLKPAGPDSVLIDLGDFAAHHDLKLDADPYALATGDKAMTPRIALGRANALAANGKPKQGLALIDKGEAAAPASARDGWALVKARYFTTTRDPRATQAWMKLADRMTDSLPVQRAALNSPGTWGHRDFVDRTIKRIRQITGEDAVAWRIDRARYLLSGPADQQDPQQALQTLQQVVAQAPDRAKPYVLIAEAQRRLDHMPLALTALERAVNLKPDAAGIRLRLGKFQQQQGAFSEAAASFTAVTRQADASANDKRAAAMALAAQGDDDVAAAALTPLAQQDPASRLALTALYLRAGQHDKAQQQVQKLLDQKPLTVQAVDLASHVYDVSGQPDKSQAVLARLDQTQADAATRQQVRARHAMRTGDLDQAAKDLRQAVDQAPQQVEGWRQLLRLNIDRGDGQALADNLADAQKAVPDDPGLTRAQSHVQLLQLAAGRIMLRPLGQAMLEDSSQGRAATQAMTMIQQAGQEKTATAKLAQKLTDLAQQHNRFLALRMVSAKLWLAIGQPRKSAALAKQARQDFPAQAEPPAVEAQSLASLGQWDAALVAARDWRRRDPGRARDTDGLIARAQVSLGRPGEALRTLKPYVAEMTRRPDDSRPMLAIYTNALARAGQASEAKRILQPLAQNAQAWRGTWVNLAASSIPDTETAAQWLNQAERWIPDKATAQREQLASAWWAVGTRGNRPQWTRRAAELLDQLLKRPDASGQAWLLRAIIAENAENLPAAEADYRNAMKRLPDTPVIKNNLAMVVVHRGGDLSEALSLAKQASQSRPNNPNFLDTLATIQAKTGQFDQARETIQKAIDMDRGNPQWEQTRQKIQQMASAAKSNG